MFMDFHRCSWTFIDLQGFRGPRFSGLWQPVAPDGDGVVPPKQLVLEASGLVILEVLRLGGLEAWTGSE